MPLYPPAGVALLSGAAFTGVVTDGNVTVPALPGGPYTGGTALTDIFDGTSIPANTVTAAGQIYLLELWGKVTTTANGQTLTWQTFYGGTGGTSIATSGAAVVSAGSTVTNASVRYSALIQFLSATSAAVEAALSMNFFLITQGQQVTTVDTTTTKALAVGMTPSAAGVSLTVSGGFCRRIN